MTDWETSEDWALRKQQINAMLDEYEREIARYRKWFAQWKARQPKGFKAIRRKSEAA
jgi:hypothetical protein